MVRANLFCQEVAPPPPTVLAVTFFNVPDRGSSRIERTDPALSRGWEWVVLHPFPAPGTFFGAGRQGRVERPAATTGSPARPGEASC